MVDQKQLRELMKREKEQRAKAKPAPAATGRQRPGQRVGAAPVSAAPAASAVAAQPQRKLEAAPAAPPPTVPSAESRKEVKVASAAPPSGSLVGAYDADSDEEAEPEPKRAKVESGDSSAMPPPPVPVAKRADAAADALAMPPPALPVRASKAATPGAQPETSAPSATPVAGRTAQPTSKALALIEEEEMAPGPLLPSQLLTESQLVVAPAEPAGGSSTEADGSAEAEDPDAAPDLPQGFFDDPEQDAKARGVEAPSVIAQRELEEGLKKFEKEMALEREKAEEARHEIDEAKYEQAAAEEEDFQRSLQGRLALLRKQNADKAAAAAAARAAVEKQAAEEQMGADEADDAADSDDSDVDFDWRAKHFG